MTILQIITLICSSLSLIINGITISIIIKTDKELKEMKNNEKI